MTEADIRASHRQRLALVYIRQSTLAQVERNTESTRRQYALALRARELGWPEERLQVIDQDLGRSGASTHLRDGFQHLTAEVALGHAGIILSLEASRLARSSADWHRLIELCAVTHTLIADADGLYNPADFNDRLLLGLKATLSEAELHTLRLRLLEGLRAKAARGELRLRLPVGLVWGEHEGEILLDPDEEVARALRSVFERFAVLGSVRRVWLWFLEQKLPFPSRQHNGELRWLPPSYRTLNNVLAHPAYAGAYVYGRTRTEVCLDQDGQLRKRVRRLPQAQWRVLIPNHHPGYIDWQTFEANRARIDSNSRPVPNAAGGSVREGSALLQGLGMCGHCGRRLHTHYRGQRNAPNYHCQGPRPMAGRGDYCLSLGGMQIDQAVAAKVLEVVRESGAEAARLALEQAGSEREAVLQQKRLAVERAQYEETRAQRAYNAVDPENRRVARVREREWEQRMAQLEEASSDLQLAESQQPRALDAEEKAALLAWSEDLPQAWEAPTTTIRDRKELLRTLLDEVVLTVPREATEVRIRMVWRSGQYTDLAVPRTLRKPRAAMRTSEDTVELVRKLAALYPDAVIAGILNRQGRRTARGLRFTQARVASLRWSRKIARYRPPPQAPDGEVVNVRQAAKRLGVARSTIHRMLNAGFLAGEQVTPGAPWEIRLTREVRERFVAEAPPGYVPMIEATARLGVSRPTVLEWIRRGKLDAVTICKGRRRGLRIRLPADNEPRLFAGEPERKADSCTESSPAADQPVRPSDA